MIIGCDFRSRFQQIAILDPTTGEFEERRLEHANDEVRSFYAGLAAPALAEGSSIRAMERMNRTGV